MKRLILICLSCLCLLSARSLRASSPQLPAGLHIDTIQVIGSLIVGQTVQLKVKFRSFVAGDMKLTLLFPGSFVPIDQSTGETKRQETIAVSTGLVYERNYQFKMTRDGTSYVEVVTSTIESPNIPPTSSTRLLGIDSDGQNFTTFYERRSTSKNFTEISAPAPPQGAPAVTSEIYIKGKVYYDESDNDQRTGIAGVTVLLKLRNQTDPNSL